MVYTAALDSLANPGLENSHKSSVISEDINVGVASDK